MLHKPMTSALRPLVAQAAHPCKGLAAILSGAIKSRETSSHLQGSLAWYRARANRDIRLSTKETIAA